MAKLTGDWGTEDATEPERIHVHASPDEHDRIGPMPDPNYAWAYGRRVHYRQQPDGTYKMLDPQPYYTRDIPADRQVVRQIAKAVEIETDDQKLIDWMTQG